MNTKPELSARRLAIAAALVVGGAGLAAADVSVGIGWGLALVGAALAAESRTDHSPGRRRGPLRSWR
jgi:hypothetical protein